MTIYSARLIQLVAGSSPVNKQYTSLVTPVSLKMS